LGQTLHSGRYVHAVPINSFFLRNEISKVHSNPKLHAALFGQLGISSSKLSLDLNGTTHRIHHTGEFSQEVVAGRVHHPAPVLFNVNGHCPAIIRQFTDGRFLVVSHETAVSRDIGTQNGS
jgi:hypothetical protein